MNGRPGWLQTMVARAQTTLATLLAWLNPAAAAAPLSPCSLNTNSQLSGVSDAAMPRSHADSRCTRAAIWDLFCRTSAPPFCRVVTLFPRQAIVTGFIPERAVFRLRDLEGHRVVGDTAESGAKSQNNY